MGLRKKAFGITAAAACLALLVAGCTGDSSTEDEGDDDGAATGDVEPATVRVMLWGNDADISSIKDAAAGFSTARPEITIEWESGDCGVDYAACKTLVAGGNTPDVFVMGSWNYFEAARDGVTADLTPYLEESGTTTDDFTPAIIDALTSPSDGKLYGLPMGYNIQSLFYNKDMFDAAGLDYPPADGSYTYDDLREWAAKLTLDGSGNDATAAGFDPNAIQQYGYFNFAAAPIEPGYAPVLAAFGGGILGGDARNECTADSEGTIEGFQWLQDLMWTDHSAITPQLQQEEPGYARWSAARSPCSRFSRAGARRPAAEPRAQLRHRRPARGSGRQRDAGADPRLGDVRASEHKDAAWEFLHYMATEGAGKQMGLIPAYQDVAQGPAFAQAEGEPEGLVEAQIDPAGWDLTFTNVDPSVVWSAVSSQDGIAPAIEDIIMNRATAAEALDGICASRIDALLDAAK